MGDMPSILSVYLTPDFRPIWEVLEAMMERDHVNRSTFVKRALAEWAVEHASLDPSYVVKVDAEQQMRTQIGAKPPCRWRLMTSPSSLVCKVDGLQEQKGLGACLDCEGYEPRTIP